MENLTLRIDGDKLIIEIDLTMRGRPSKSGRSAVISCSGGNIPLVTPDGQYRPERLNLTVSRAITQDDLENWPGDDMADTTERT
ncbi:MAG: hypothetical protein FJ118_09160 [Deltaproteobacteria bacterium]|nr:hypothetical protein [Deltaproteobacteria bacterium]